MEKVLAVVNWIFASGPNLVSALNAVILAIIALSLLIPGEQPEKALQGVADFLAKFSKKKE